MIFERVKDLIAQQLDVDAEAITEETDFVVDLNADSLDVVELSMSVEEDFGIPEISDEDLRAIHTVGDLVAYISRAVDALE